MAEQGQHSGDMLSFGPFRLIAGERLLLRGDTPVELGARTLDTLIALVSRPNEIIGKRELMALIWPDVVVEEGSLRFHIAGLRKALGDGRDGARYIATLAGRGYCFVAPVTHSGGAASIPVTVATGWTGPSFLPGNLGRMVGRDASVAAILALLESSRFVTITGPAGVGKTTVAVAVGHALLDRFAGAVLFVDFGTLSDPAIVAASVASMLGIPIQSDDPAPGLIAWLRDRRLLLVLDNCEHVVDAAARLAQDIFRAAPQVHILATSREALRVEGERVHPLAPLTAPPDEPGLTAEDVLAFPAARLFVDRVAASGAELELGDAEAAIVARLCRKLDGVPLAVELAAGRVGTYGLRHTVALLDQRLALLWQGQRTAPPRQQTMQATLDWSYRLLSEVERVVLRRLAIFVGNFTIEAALAVVPGGAVEASVVFAAIDGLVAKSMVATRPAGAMMRYRLLDTTRNYLRTIDADASDHADLAARHAAFYRRWLVQTAAEWPNLPSAAERSPRLAELGNVRAALDWSFAPGGDERIGIDLAAAAAPVFLAMSLLTECHRWSERALGALAHSARGGREEMHLQAALGLSLMFTRGSSEEARTALNRSLAIADQRGDALNQLQLLGPLQMFHLRLGDFSTALHYGRRGTAVSQAMEDPAALALAHALLGLSLHFTGELGDARRELEAALRQGPAALPGGTTYLGFDGRNLAGAALARTFWLQGCPVRALDCARRSVREAAATDHPVTLSVALIWAVTVFFWTGDLDSAADHIDLFCARARSAPHGPYVVVGRAFRGELAIRRGDAAAGVESLRACLEELRAARYELLTTSFRIALVQGLTITGRFAEALALVDDTIALVEANGHFSYLPELLRVKGRLLCAMPHPRGAEAESCFLASLDLSRRQGALAWELRTAIDLAALHDEQARPEAARALLQPLIGQFVEGMDTADLVAAGQLIASLART